MARSRNDQRSRRLEKSWTDGTLSKFERSQKIELARKVAVDEIDSESPLDIEAHARIRPFKMDEIVIETCFGRFRFKRTGRTAHAVMIS